MVTVKLVENPHPAIAVIKQVLKMRVEKQFEMLSQYNMWMNQNIFKLCDSLTDEIRNKDMGAFFGSIHRTLDHILYGDKAWLLPSIGLPNLKLLGDGL